MIQETNLHRPVRAHVEAALVPSDDPYPPPLDQLLQLGSALEAEDIEKRIAGLGLTQEHVPDLVRLARDYRLNTIDEDTPEIWGPVHAIVALRSLDVGPYAADLIPLLDVDSEWHTEEIPVILGRAGEPVLDPLRDYILDQSRWIYGRAAAGQALAEIGTQHPSLRERAEQILIEALGQFETNLPELNAFLITNLVTNLRSEAALPTIRRTFEAGRVDEGVRGDWLHVLEEIGQEPDPDDPLVIRYREERSRQRLVTLSPGGSAPAGKRTGASQRSAKTEKSKRKMSAASRKANKKKRKK